MNIISTQTHLKRLGEAVFSIEDHCVELFEAMKLLEYAANLTRIEYSPFSEAGMYCKGIFEDELIEQQTMEAYLLHLSIFSMSWMGLESIINEVLHQDKEKSPQHKGKIHALCSQLKSYSSKITVPREYKKCLSDWKKIEKELNDKYKYKNSTPPSVDLAGEGIYRVYTLRNHLFHGDFTCILPSDPLWNNYIQSLKLGTRIIAFTIQMFLMAHFSDKKYIATWWHGSLQEYTDQICIERAFKLLHLEWV
ncbi:MAG: hypothetical protein PHW64_07725 [Sulfuricurvum sp.]|nr:hypothetical protein [Sulfuricurvum sp.]